MYRAGGAGPPVVLIHGMVNSSKHWEAVGSRLADGHAVIAPDLLGHGGSAKPEGDYSLGAHASGIRDLLSALGIDRATIVGHSLGGGIAMQFYYQFPHRCERLVLVSSGGLGREVGVLLRVVALPSAEALIALAASRPVVAALDAAARLPGGARAPLQAAARALGSLDERGARRAFIHTLRSVIGARGQRVSARDRLYLAGAVPTLIVWGDRDRTIPLRHAHVAHRGMPGSRLELVEGARHFPHLEQPECVAEILRDFVATSEPGRVDDAGWRRLLAREAAAAAEPSPDGRPAGERAAPRGTR